MRTSSARRAPTASAWSRVSLGSPWPSIRTTTSGMLAQPLRLGRQKSAVAGARQAARCRRRNRPCRCPIWRAKSARSASMPSSTGAGGAGGRACRQARELRRRRWPRPAQSDEQEQSGASVDRSPTSRDRSRPAGSSTWRGSLPSTAIPGRAPGVRPAPVRWKTSSRLLAAQLGASSVGPAVSSCSPLPSGLMTPIRSPAPEPRRVKAIHSPSGLHVGRRIPAAAEADPALARCRRRSSHRAAASPRGRFRTRSGSPSGEKLGVGVDARRGGQPLRQRRRSASTT